MFNENNILLTCIKEVVNHFGKKDPVVMMPVDDMEGGKNIPSTVILLLKWAVEMMKKHSYPNEFLEFIFKKTMG